jgi:hypothetical protein
MSRKWSRNEKLTAGGLIVTVIVGLTALVIAVTVPEIRRALHLEKTPAPVAVWTPEPLKPAVPPQEPKPEPKPVVHQQAKAKVAGEKNVAGNNISGQKNVTGNGNAVAPNGIAITGGNVTNPTVINNGPPSHPPAEIRVCSSKSTPDNTGAVFQVFTLTTDSPVEAPRYNFSFSSVLPAGTSASSPDMAMNVREGQSDSRFAFQIFQTWYPTQRINVEVRSADPIPLPQVSGEHGESFVSSSGDCKSGL